MYMKERMTMKMYRKFSQPFEAFQMTKENQLSNSEWPPWLHKAWQIPVDAMGSVFSNPNAAKPGEPFTFFLNNEIGLFRVRRGDWIVRERDGSLRLWCKAAFEAACELVEGQI